MNRPISYYTKPPDDQFDECKRECIKIWQTYDDTYGYASEKIDLIKHLGNVRENFMYMVAMFDNINQRKLARVPTPETRKAIADRIKAGGGDDQYNEFLEQHALD